MLNIIQWIILSILVGLLVGSASAFFLVSLDMVTSYRETHLWLIAFLPLAGLVVGALYHYFGESIQAGNNLLLEEYHVPRARIPWYMAPMILLTTLITHIFGGSAGREGTAVQMGGAIADQFSKFFDIKTIERKTLIIIGISAGFAAVFGTPLAGTIFSLEVLTFGQIRWRALLPSLTTALLADYTCSQFWNVHHGHYQVEAPLRLDFWMFCQATLVGVFCGLAALFFIYLQKKIKEKAAQWIAFPPFRPMFAGVIIALAVYAMGTTKYIGLGIPVIQEAFSQNQSLEVFLIKIIFTTFTLGMGFKGGEVTPLFFIGATLGSALTFFLPLPTSLLAAMGFVSVFAAATNTPLACIIMAVELFGSSSVVYVAISVTVAQFCSGENSIYKVFKSD